MGWSSTAADEQTACLELVGLITDNDWVFLMPPHCWKATAARIVPEACVTAATQLGA